MNNLISYLKSFGPLPAQLESQLAMTVKARHAEKNECLILQGQVCRHVYFVKSGLVRRFHPEDDKEVTTFLAMENDVVFSMPGFCDHSPASDSIQAIKPAELLYISYDGLQELFQLFPEFYNTCNRILIHCLKRVEQHRNVLQMSHIDDRVRYMVAEQPELVQRVPDKILASYLRCTAEYLSRIKAKKY